MRIFLTVLFFAILIELMVISHNRADAQSVNNPRSFATANADTVQAMTNQFSTLVSNHFSFVFNNSNVPALFTVTYQLCAVNNGCTIKAITETLDPHIGVQQFWTLTLQALYTTPAVYNITATTTIVGPNVNVIATGRSVANIITPFMQNVH